jgi:hypothetical protein
VSRALVIASAVITLAAGVLYLREALREARPQMVSWLGWTALLVIGAISALDSGQVPAAVYLLSCAAMCAAVIAATARRGQWSLTWLDRVCLAGVVAGLAALLAFRSPVTATWITVAVDAAAYVPTAVHAWRQPAEEPWLAFAGWSAGAALSLAAAHVLAFTAVAYPGYLLAADSAVTVMILARVNGPVSRSSIRQGSGLLIRHVKVRVLPRERSSTRSCRGARSPRHPVKVQIAGSNPVSPASGGVTGRTRRSRP